MYFLFDLFKKACYNLGIKIKKGGHEKIALAFDKNKKFYKGNYTMDKNETQEQISFQEEFMDIVKSESQIPESATATAYEMLAAGTGLMPSKFAALPWQWQEAFQNAITASYEAGFRDGCKLTNGLKP